MKRIFTALLFAGCLLGTPNLRGQELPGPTTTATTDFRPGFYIPRLEQPRKIEFGTAFPALPTTLLEETRARQIQVQKTALERMKLQKRNFRVEVQVWGINTGNHINNWSTFPDRMLDARTLSMPLPRRLMDKFPIKQ